MRFLLVVLLASTAFHTIATHAADAPPPSSLPLTEEISEEPQVTIVKKQDMVLEEYRLGGKLYLIKVTPKIGKPYYLVDERGDGKFTRQESLDSGFRPPHWVILNF